jgi:hypothetical protein
VLLECRLLRTAKFKTEAALAAEVVKYFQTGGWEVYQEVKALGQRADMVCRKGSVIVVVECKLSASFSVIDQAMQWLGAASAVWVATPPGRHSPSWWRVLDMLGVGCLLVRPSGHIAIRGAPKLNRKPNPKWSSWLHPQQQTENVAGTRGKYWTPFHETCIQLTKYVEQNPGVTLACAVAHINHHYTRGATACRCLAEMLRKGVI